MKRGPEPKYPELYNLAWMEDHAELDKEEMASLLGCSSNTAYRQIAAMELPSGGRNNVWTPLETTMLKRFFPRYPTRLIMATLRRTHAGVSQRAHLLGLKKVWGEERGTEEEFWPEWQVYLFSAEIKRLLMPSARKRFLDLIYAPRTTESVRCSRCQCRPGCVGAAKEPLPCMTTTLYNEVARRGNGVQFGLGKEEHSP
jgi:hypothetical protein